LGKQHKTGFDCKQRPRELILRSFAVKIAMQDLFDLPEDYDAMLRKGIGLTGNSRQFFIEGRLNFLLSQLQNPSSVQRILDFGCGTGETTIALAEKFPKAEVWGSDVSESAIEWAKKKHQHPRVYYFTDAELDHEIFDLIYLNGVLHHIPLDLRQGTVDRLFALCAPMGSVWLFENNPLNPGTQWAMYANPFDQGVVKVWPTQGRYFIEKAGFEIKKTRYLFYFPQWLAFLRPLESILFRVPFGGQYCIIANRGISI
jgi:SAM-dependent methyltransferase